MPVTTIETPADLPVMLNAAQYGAHWGIHPRTALRWVREGRLPAEHLGIAVRIPRDAVPTKATA